MPVIICNHRQPWYSFTFLISILILAACDSIDEDIVRGATNLNAFDIFHVNSEYIINIKSQLDMLIPIDQYKIIFGTSNREKRKAVKFLSERWPNGKVLYRISAGLNVYYNVIKDAMEHWKNYTCITFVENQTADSYVEIILGSSCAANVGYSSTRQQLLLNENCISKGTLIHEIGHTIGFYHEHARPDRDLYITFDSSKIPIYELVNYNKIITNINLYNISYDYSSIMHYKASQIITTVDPAYQNIIGNRVGLSFKDIKLANLMYNCSSLGGDCPKKICPFHGFVFFKPFKGQPKCECFCDSGNVSDPLVPCRFITKEVPEPQIKDKEVNEPHIRDRLNVSIEKNITSCVDIRSDCEDLKKLNWCLSEPRIMLTQCKYSCNFCGKGDNLCMDYSSGCEMMILFCSDFELKEIMHAMCPKTCLICENPSTACGIEKSLKSTSKSSRSNELTIKINDKSTMFMATYVLFLIIVTQL